MATLLNCNELINAGSLSLHLSLCDLGDLPKNATGNTKSIVIVNIRRWVENSAEEDVYLFAANPIFEVQKNTHKIFVGFMSKSDRDGFDDWYVRFIKEFGSYSDWAKERLWPDKEDFNQLLNSKEPVSAQAYIEYELRQYDEYGEIDDNVFCVWNWLQNHANSSVFRWNKNFVFSNSKDAALFKLRWLGEDCDYKD